MLVRRARRGRRALLSQRAGGRGGVRRQGQGHARDACSAICRSARATTSSSTAASCTATASTPGRAAEAARSSRAAGTCVRRSATATSSASSSRARRTRERDIRRPRELDTHDEMGDFRILVKQYDGINEIILDHHPFDVVGWDGYFYPWAFNIHDFEPIVGRVHQPPPVHQTFEGDGFVVCSFCPRPFDFRSGSGARAVQPQQRGLGRGDLLCARASS